MARLSERQRRIVRLVQMSEGPVTGAELARELGVSLRTVQGEIARINREGAVVASSNRGYVLAQGVELAQGSDAAQGSPEDAALHLVARRLVIERGSLSVDELESLLFVSRSAAERLVSAVRERLAELGLELSRSRGQLEIAGSEPNRRRLLSRLVLEEVALGRPTGGTTESMSDLLGLDAVREILARCAHRASQYVEPGYEASLAAGLAIALFRLRSAQAAGAPVPTAPADATLERRIATDICSEYAERWPLALDERDVEQVEAFLVGQLRPARPAIERDLSVAGCDELGAQIESMVRDALAPYGIELERTPALLGLVLHVSQLMRRQSAQQVVDQGVLEGVKMSYPFVFEIAQIVANELAERFELRIEEGELGFLCIHLGLVVGEQDGDRLRVGLLSETYRSVADNLRNRLIMRFGSEADVVSYDSAADLLRDAGGGRIDLIVTTGAPFSSSIPCVRISPLLVADDLLAVERAVVRQADLRRKALRGSVREFFSPRLFLRHTEERALSRDEAIELLCSALMAEGVVDEGFAASVRERERAGSTCFFERFAIPHALEMRARRTAFCVLVSDAGVRWDGPIIHVVLMIAVCREDRSRFMTIFDSAVKSLSEDARIEALSHAPTLASFLSILFG